MNKQINLVIFDLDGVITSTDTLHFLAWQKTIKQFFNLTIKKEDVNLLRGISRNESLLRLIKKYNLKLNSKKQFKKMLKIKNNQYLANLQKLTKENLKPNIYELITFLKTQGILIGLGSASANAPLIIKKLGLEKYFDIVVNVKKIKKPKPAPELFLAVAKKAKINDLSTCLVIEDAQAGIEAANAAKMIAIGYSQTNSLKKCHFLTDNHLLIKNWIIKNYL